MSILERLAEGVCTGSAEETRALAADLGRALPPDTTLALHGNLGVGKTTFVQGLAAGLGIDEMVTSPTFNIFTLHRGRGRTLVHLDAYRLDRPEQVEDLMLDDFLVSPWVLAVEWPERVAGWVPAEAWHLELGIEAPGRHRLRLLRPV
jgi:tRNA threonylcarbamoyladenosine biosynthesis protein TsaE